MSGTLIAYRLNHAGVTFFVLALMSFSVALYSNAIHKKRNVNSKERKILLRKALEIIDARARLTVDLVANFRESVNKYGYSLPKEQKEFISNLLSAAGDVRINDEELKSNNLMQCKRSSLIAERRALLNKIEKSRSVIEGYLHENT